MTVNVFQESVSTKALLALFMDGKSIDDKDLQEPLYALEFINNLHCLIEEFYLLSIVHYLSPFKKVNSLEQAIKVIESRLEELDMQTVWGALAYKKYFFGKILCGDKSFISKKEKSFLYTESLSSVVELSHYATLCFFIGIFLNLPEEMNEGREITESIDIFIKENGEVDFLFLLRAGQYNKDSYRVILFILSSLYLMITKNEFIEQKNHKLDPFEGGLFQTLDVESRLLCRLLKKVKEVAFTIEKSEGKEGFLEGRILLGKEGFTFSSITEKKVGLGSISYKDHILIPTFGPHLLPLGKNDIYGLSAPICKETGSIGSKISMWNRVYSDSDYAQHWIFSNIDAKENSLSIESLLWSEVNEEKLSLVFFVRGGFVKVENRTYFPSGLERVLVHTSKIDIETGGKTLCCSLKEAMDIEIIPLAGGEFFFNCDFLLSFPFSSDRPLRIDFVMD